MRVPLLLLGIGLALPALAVAEEPIREVQHVVDIPPGMEPAAALQTVSDIAAIFELYDPSIPWVPGVNIELSKEVVSAADPCVLSIPVEGSAIGKGLHERALVTATSAPAACGGVADGRVIVLSFADSSRNIERRIDRIEITACLEAGESPRRIVATGRMYAGYLPEDPEFNAIAESIGSKAIQGAFLRQVGPIVDAVEQHWDEVVAESVASLQGP